jgi:aryl-alcohol dehydrogenase-like predicted oxidoreductase
MADSIGTVLDRAPLIIGCWAWGDNRTWGYGSRFGRDDLRMAVDTLEVAGLRCFDTAEVYAGGRSEQLLGDLLAGRSNIAVSSKFFPYPWRLTGGQFRRALAASLRKLRRDCIELYQIHHEVPAALARRWASHLAAARRDGCIETIGTSNLSVPALRTMIEAVRSGLSSLDVHLMVIWGPQYADER